MTTTFGADLVDKTKQAKVNAIKSRLKSAAKAADQLESDVRWLVSNRAWETLGHKDFSDMWEKENGFKCPTVARVLAVAELQSEGMNTARGGERVHERVNGHTQPDVARAVGFPVYKQTHAQGYRAPTVGNIVKQLDAGVEPDKVIISDDQRAIFRIIDRHGTRARPQPRRMAKGPDERVSASVNPTRAEDDEIAEIARQNGVPKAEIYRQAVAEYLMRYRESRPVTREGEAS